MNKLMERQEYTITEEVVFQQDSTDTAINLTVETENETFEFQFAYGNLVNFVRCKK